MNGDAVGAVVIFVLALACCISGVVAARRDIQVRNRIGGRS